MGGRGKVSMRVKGIFGVGGFRVWVGDGVRAGFGDLGKKAAEGLEVRVFHKELGQALGSDDVDLYGGRRKVIAMEEEGRGDGVGGPVDCGVDEG